LILQTTRKKTTTGALAVALALSSGVALGAPPKLVPLPRPRPHMIATAPGSTVVRAEFHTASLAPAASAIAKDDTAVPFSSDASVSKSDLSAVK